MKHPQLEKFSESSSTEWQKMKPGLERIQEACDLFKHPESKFKSIHIAGTNGKGSVAAILQSILSESGLKVGLFTSPHLMKLNERFRVGNQEILDEELEKYLEIISRKHPLSVDTPLRGATSLEERVRERSDFRVSDLPSLPSLTNEGKELSFFEICTLIAFLFFAEQKVDVAILETGLGGRFDATNVVKPIISVITEIGMDHTEILGSDIASIAREKAGIIKEGVPVVCGASHPEARRVIEEVAKEKNAPIFFVGAPPRGRPQIRVGTETHPYNFPYELNLPGDHQIHNAKIVLKVIEVWNETVGAPIGAPVLEESVQLGFQNVRWPGRLEWISKDPPILLDGAHNVDGMKALVVYLSRGDACLAHPIKWKVLFSAASDKQVKEMLSCLQEIADEIILCKMKNSRSMDPEKVMDSVGAPLGAPNVRVRQAAPLRISNDSAQAFREIKKSLREGEGILITGSLYFIGEMKTLMTKLNPTIG